MEITYRKSLVRSAYVLCIVWLLGTVFAFWWFQFKDVQVFNRAYIDTKANFQPTSLNYNLEQLMSEEFSYLFKGDKPVVFHLQKPGCACNRFNNVHLQKLVAEYAEQGVQFFSLTSVNATSNTISQLKEKTGIDQVAQSRALQNLLQNISTPAALVFDGKGTLNYLGPYSSGALCSTASGQYVETSLDALLNEKTAFAMPEQAVGCFCPWNQI